MTAFDAAAAKALLADPEVTIRAAAKKMGIAVSTLYRHVPPQRTSSDEKEILFVRLSPSEDRWIAEGRRFFKSASRSQVVEEALNRYLSLVEQTKRLVQCPEPSCDSETAAAYAGRRFSIRRGLVQWLRRVSDEYRCSQSELVRFALADFAANFNVEGGPTLQRSACGGGRPRKLSADQQARVRELLQAGHSVGEVARAFKVSPITIYRYRAGICRSTQPRGPESRRVRKLPEEQLRPPPR